MVSQKYLRTAGDQGRLLWLAGVMSQLHLDVTKKDALSDSLFFFLFSTFTVESSPLVMEAMSKEK